MGKTYKRSKEMNLLEQYTEKQINKLSENKVIPEFRPGDTVKVHNKIIEESTERIQIFEGVCIARRNRDLGSSFKVKKISSGKCVEKTFPLYSPLVTKIEVLRKGKVRQAKLYYMRELVGKAARIKERVKLSVRAKKKS